MITKKTKALIGYEVPNIYCDADNMAVLFLSVLVKVQLFWEGHKKLCNLPYGFDIYLVNVKIIRQIVQIFVAFFEKLNFT